MAKKNNSNLNKGAVAAKKNAEVKTITKEGEIELDLSIWISNLGELQDDLVEAVEKGRSTKKIESEILDLKEKIRNAMNILSGADAVEDYKKILSQAREIIEREVKKVKAKTVPVEKKPKKKKKKKFSGKQIAALKKLSSKKKPKKKAKRGPLSIFELVEGEDDAPISERLMLLQTSMIDIFSLAKELIEDNPFSGTIFEKAKSTWMANIAVALDTEHEYILSLDTTMTDTIEAIQDAEIAEEEDV